jgi:hypothetical protein
VLLLQEVGHKITVKKFGDGDAAWDALQMHARTAAAAAGGGGGGAARTCCLQATHRGAGEGAVVLLTLV